MDYCESRARFLDQGETYRNTGCALSVEIDGNVYSHYETLQADDSDNPCSKLCGTSSYSGLLVFDGLPNC